MSEIPGRADALPDPHRQIWARKKLIHRNAIRVHRNAIRAKREAALPGGLSREPIECLFRLHAAVRLAFFNPEAASDSVEHRRL